MHVSSGPLGLSFEKNLQTRSIACPMFLFDLVSHAKLTMHSNICHNVLTNLILGRCALLGRPTRCSVRILSTFFKPHRTFDFPSHKYTCLRTSVGAQWDSSTLLGSECIMHARFDFIACGHQNAMWRTRPRVARNQLLLRMPAQRNCTRSACACWCVLINAQLLASCT